MAGQAGTFNIGADGIIAQDVPGDPPGGRLPLAVPALRPFRPVDSPKDARLNSEVTRQLEYHSCYGQR